MLTIRLSRTGKKKQPQYRVVLQESHRDPWSPAKEILGHYNPRALKDQVVLNADRIKELLANGAQPSSTVHNMLVTAGIIKADKQSTVTISNKRAKSIESKKSAEETKKREAIEAEKAKKEAEAQKKAQEAEAEKIAKEAEEAKKAEESAEVKEETKVETPAVETPA